MNFFNRLIDWVQVKLYRYEEQRFLNHFGNAQDIADVERILRELHRRYPGAYL